MTTDYPFTSLLGYKLSNLQIPSFLVHYNYSYA